MRERRELTQHSKSAELREMQRACTFSLVKVKVAAIAGDECDPATSSAS